MPAIIWIGGWASPLSIWSQELSELLPDASHYFWDAHEFLDRATELRQKLSELPEGSRVVAWSLGSLLALELAAKGDWPRGVHLFAVCPVLDFCDPQGPWRPLVLDRMIRALGKDLLGTLTAFCQRMWPLMPAAFAQRWLSGACEIPNALLVRGLEALRDRRVDPSGLVGAPVTFVLATHDCVGPKPVWAPGACVCIDSGHVPFLENPFAFGQILSTDNFRGI